MDDIIDNTIKKISNYLHSNISTPLLVNFQSKNDVEKITSYFDVNPNIDFVRIDSFSKIEDELPPIELIIDTLSNSHKPIFLYDISSYLRLFGEYEVSTRLKEFLTLSLKTKAVIFAFQCESYLHFQDIRLKNNIIEVPGQKDIIPNIFFVDSEIKKENILFIKGIKYLPKALECQNEDIYVMTGKRKNLFSETTVHIKEISSYYNLISNIDGTIESLSETFGTKEQWKNLYSDLLNNPSSNLDSVLMKRFGNLKRLDLIINSLHLDNEYEQWLLFIALKLNGTPDNNYLDLAIKHSESFEELIKSLYREILSYDVKAENFIIVYNQRKALLKDFAKSTDAVSDFCQYVEIKGKNSIYYLTDNTQIEKETLLRLLDCYANEFSYEELMTILKLVNKNFYLYLENNYKFTEDYLQSYFKEYKYLKVINKITPEFKEKVEYQAIHRDYLRWLTPRTSVLESIDTSAAEYYFVDAMGVEFLSYILAKCSENKLVTNVRICHSELPSITSCNKDFVEYFDGKSIPRTDIKELDEIKHHGKDDFDYNKTKLPYYLIKELEIIDRIIENIKVKLSKGLIQKVILISDHGASRLAVINDSNIIEIDQSSKGSHGGRICDYVEGMPSVSASIKIDNNLVLANYDRFRGSRAAAVETHGGATLEEVTIPIIEVTLKAFNYEIELVTKDILVSFRKKAEISLFSKTELNNVIISINGKMYSGIKNNNLYTFEIPEIKKAGTYMFDVYSNNNLVKAGLSFNVKKEGASENDLF